MTKSFDSLDKTFDIVPEEEKKIKPIKKPKYLLQSYLHYMKPETLGEPSQWDIETVYRLWKVDRKKDAIDRVRDLHKKFPNSEQVNRLMEMTGEG